MNLSLNENELERRLALIKQGVPNQGNNKSPFAIPAFELFKDCGLVTPKNISFLSDKNRCDEYFGCTMNPLGGVLRHQDLPMIDYGGVWRYYYAGKNNLYVTLEGVRYYVSNYWQYGCKEAFFKWLSAEAWRVCKERWEQGEIEPPPIDKMQPTIEELVQTLIRENKELIETNKGLCSLVTTLDRRIGILEGKIDELKRIWDN